MKRLSILFSILMVGCSSSPAFAPSVPLPAQSRSGDNRGIAASVNILDFGAKCDGVTNDTDAVLRAITAGARVVIPPTGYSRPCIFNSTLRTNGALLEGAGPSRSVLKFMGSNSTAIQITAPMPMQANFSGLDGIHVLNGGNNNNGVVLGPALNPQISRSRIDGFVKGLYVPKVGGCVIGFRMSATDFWNNGQNVSWEAGSENILFENVLFGHGDAAGSSLFSGGLDGCSGAGSYPTDFSFISPSFDGDTPQFTASEATILGGHFESVIKSRDYAMTVGSASGPRALVTLVGTTLAFYRPNYAFPNDSFFHVLSTGSLTLRDVKTCSPIPAYKFIDADVGAAGVIDNPSSITCAGYPAKQMWTGASKSIIQLP